MAAVPSGLFAVYKAPGVAWNRVRDAVEARLLRGERSSGTPPQYTATPHTRRSPIIAPFLAELNAAPARPPRSRIRFLPAASAGPPGLVAVRVPVLAEHRLGKRRERRGERRGNGPGLIAVCFRSSRAPLHAAEDRRRAPAGREGLGGVRCERGAARLGGRDPKAARAVRRPPAAPGAAVPPRRAAAPARL